MRENDIDTIQVPGYHFYPINRNNPEGAARGGVGIFIRHEIKKYIKIRPDISNENFLWCKINKEYTGYHDDLFICITYIPPEGSTREKRINIDHFKIMQETTAKIKSDNIILIGDFNARTAQKVDTLTQDSFHQDDLPINFYSKIETDRNNKDKVVNKYGKNLCDYCIATQSYIANGRTIGDLQGNMTCFEENGTSAVDYAIVNENLYNSIKMFQVLDPSTGSDHSPIKIELELKKKTLEKINEQLVEKPQPIRWNSKTEFIFRNRMNSAEMTQLLQEIDELLTTDADINKVVEKIGEIYDTDLNKEKQKNRTKKKTKPAQKRWYDKTCEEASRQLKQTAKLLSRSPKNPNIRGNFQKARKQYKKIIKSKKIEWRNKTIQQLEKIEANNPKEYWKLVKELRENKQNDKEFDAKKFTDFFEKLYAPTEKVNEDIRQNVIKTLDQLPNLSNEPDFTLDELLKAIKSLKNNKATGLDRIPAEMLKTSSENIMSILLKTMNKIKNTFKCPAKWAIGITSLLFKDGDEDDPNNYRAITVTDALSKILAILLNNRVEKWCTANNVIKKERIGFEKKSRPGDHLFVLKTLIEHYKQQGKKLYACFVDFQKAFDSVWRLGLLHKLITYGLDIGYIKLIKDMYDKTAQSLRINSRMTRIFKTYKGVKQGCILSPRLFNLFINDIPDLFSDDKMTNPCKPVHLNDTKINCLMYADDLILLSESEEGLQTCLNRLNEYNEKWDLKLNIKKTKVLIFQNNGKKSQTSFKIGENFLQIATEYKYLGTIITNTGSFKTNEIKLKQKGLRASFIISKNIGPYAKPSTSIRLFEKLIEPILLHNCEISSAYFPHKQSQVVI